MAGNRRDCLSMSQTLKSVILIIILQLALTIDASIQDSVQEAMFYNVGSASLIGNVTMVKQARSELDCAFTCLRNYPRSCFSFNFGRIAINELHTCELSNSERALEPHKMQSRKGFDYFGMESVYLARFFPCLLSPCRNGGSCVNGPALEMFSCNCPLQIEAMPYIDDKCNFNHSLIKTWNPVKDVFHAMVGRYQLNYFEAERLCEILGATLASREQLTVAWQAGFQLCRWGWLKDATTAYPMNEVRNACGNMKGIISFNIVYNKITKKSNAWCYTS